MTCLGTGSTEEVMSRQSPEEGAAFTPRQGGSTEMPGVSSVCGHHAAWRGGEQGSCGRKCCGSGCCHAR